MCCISLEFKSKIFFLHMCFHIVDEDHPMRHGTVPIYPCVTLINLVFLPVCTCLFRVQQQLIRSITPRPHQPPRAVLLGIYFRAATLAHVIAWRAGRAGWGTRAPSWARGGLISVGWAGWIFSSRWWIYEFIILGGIYNIYIHIIHYIGWWLFI
jgi:hypothetical protein